MGTTAITLEQVDQKALDEPAANFGSLKLSQAIYEARRAAADELVGDMLIDQEAKRRSVERAALYEQEVTAKVAGGDRGRDRRRGIRPTSSACRARRSIRSARRSSRC